MARDLGTKYICFKCGTKFYDLKKPVPTCPKCGTDQREAPSRKSTSSRTRAAPRPVEPERQNAPATEPGDVPTKRISQQHAGDDLALATEVAAAVDTEIDEDPEWALLARGPEAFPGELDEAEPEVSPPDEVPERNGPRD